MASRRSPPRRPGSAATASSSNCHCGAGAILAAATSEERKVEIHTAARIAADPDARAERGCLDLLAGRLGPADALVDHIEATVSGAKA